MLHSSMEKNWIRVGMQNIKWQPEIPTRKHGSWKTGIRLFLVLVWRLSVILRSEICRWAWRRIRLQDWQCGVRLMKKRRISNHPTVSWMISMIWRSIPAKWQHRAYMWILRAENDWLMRAMHWSQVWQVLVIRQRLQLLNILQNIFSIIQPGRRNTPCTILWPYISTISIQEISVCWKSLIRLWRVKQWNSFLISPKDWWKEPQLHFSILW